MYCTQIKRFKSARKVSATQLKIRKEKALLNEKSSFICEDCLPKYAKSYSCNKINQEAMEAQDIIVQVYFLKQLCYPSHTCYQQGIFMTFFTLL